MLAGKYVLNECIGTGGMGLVFRAEHPALARQIAIKILHPHLATRPMFVRRFRDEAIAASRVRHRGSVAVIDFDLTPDGTQFIAMELVPGRPLGQILHEEVIPLPRALGIQDQILDALDAVHARGVVHGDVKSDNFMVELGAGGDMVTLIDFGLAHLDGAAAEPGFIAGTPGYTAPEIVRGDAPTSVSDLYGAGAIFYELLTGATPFAGCASASEIVRRQLDEAVIPPSARRPDRIFPAALDRIVLCALDKDPRARFASAQDFRHALRTLSLGHDAPTQRRWREQAARAAAGARPLASLALPDRRPIAGRSAPSDAGHHELRRAIAGALARGDVPAIAEAYRALADALTQERHLGSAILELEEGINVITSGQEPTGAASEPVQRLVTALAAVYELAGKFEAARHLLAGADGRTTLVGVAG